MVLKNTTKQKGFTLVEMIVVCAIVGVISAIVMFNYSDFRQAIDTRNLAEELALTIRKAQTYATGSQGVFDTDGNKVNSFGMVFSTDTNSGGGFAPSAKNFTLFAALPISARGSTVQQNAYSFNTGDSCNPTKNGISLSTECLESFAITYSASISNIEFYDNNNGWVGLPASAYANVIFNRPVPDAYICSNSGAMGSLCSSPASAIRLTITSQNGKIQKYVVVWNTGQISVESVPPPSTGGTLPGDILIGTPTKGR